MLIEIKSWINGKILHSIEADSVKLAIEGLVRQEANLSWANLYRAYLSWANLSGAYLSWADLSWANLSWADLSGANLSRANLSWADLSWANLSGANLSRANLSGANLSGAKIDDLFCLCELSDAIDLAPMIFQEWEKNGLDSAKSRFGLHQVGGEEKALIAMAPLLIGGFCFVLHRREIWWWHWSCPDPETVPVLWRQEELP
jgi:hypothetical protein